MDRQKRELLIVAALLAVFGLVLVRSIARGHSKSRNEERAGEIQQMITAAERPDEEAAPGPVEGEAGPEKGGDVLKEVAYEGHGYRDPLQKPEALIALLTKPKPVPPGPVGPPAAETPLMVPIDLPVEPPKLEVKGLIWGVEPAQAIIGNQVVRVGDTVQGALITGLDAQGVHVEYKGKDFVLAVRSQYDKDEGGRLDSGMAYSPGMPYEPDAEPSY
ncbi:MAG: hypothetical protein HYY14_00205 [Candidatus Omnitrophica bacterium]|nr:hypothetical protein [Candidatus Omnitrophota bacterium]